jgi:hypothetical protein
MEIFHHNGLFSKVLVVLGTRVQELLLFYQFFFKDLNLFLRVLLGETKA